MPFFWIQKFCIFFVRKIACCGKLRDWWKHVAHPSLGDDLFLCGFARPNMTSFWITIELNARFLASYMAGTSKLPSVQEMKKVVKNNTIIKELSW